MRSIGGELEIKDIDDNIYFTDSGRSSIRLFLRSGDNRSKKYLLPDFFCEVIEKIFIDERVEYSFYKVYEDLSIDVKSINSTEFDVLYVINYFGKKVDLSSVNFKDKILIEDNVFYSDFSNDWNAKEWYAFNSYRKISLLADGSLVKTNLNIDESHIYKKEAGFVEEKYKAKKIKYLHIFANKYQELDYLKVFENAENMLDNQKDIFSMSKKSLYYLTQYPINNNLREERFNKLNSLFKEYSVLSECSEYSFFVMILKDRDLFRQKLMEKNIYLPIHWPKSSCDNKLYSNIISIPLFETYNDETFDYLVDKLKEVL